MCHGLAGLGNLRRVFMVHNDNNPNRGIATVFYTYQYLPERRQERKKKEKKRQGLVYLFCFIAFILTLF